MRQKVNLSATELLAKIEKIKRRLYSRRKGGFGGIEASEMGSGRRERLLFEQARLENERVVTMMRERGGRR